MSVALMRSGFRMLASVAPGPLFRFFGAGCKSVRAIREFERDRRKGTLFPAFLFVSVTQRCQYACRGCWARGVEDPVDMNPELLRSLIGQLREARRRFIGIMGGEPLLVPGLLEVLGSFPDCYFLLFTNGAALDAATAAKLRRCGNISPLISLEGDAEESDARRGRSGVLSQGVAAMRACREARIPFGVATSLCRGNLEVQASDSFVRWVVAQGAHYLWYYLYRPVGPDPDPERCLSEEQVLQVRTFLVEARLRHPIVLVDAYWDAEGRALCPAATGISHHINALGDVEPCPPLQVSADRLEPDGNLRGTLESSAFLADFRDFASATTRGCVLLEAPGPLTEFLGNAGSGGRDSSGRGRIFQEFSSMRVMPGHDVKDRAIPEKSWAYRLAKKCWFFGFGAYG